MRSKTTKALGTRLSLTRKRTEISGRSVAPSSLDRRLLRIQPQVMENISIFPNAPQDLVEDDFDEELGFFATVDVPLLALCFLIVTANSLVVTLFCWKHSLRTPSNVFLASMAVSDGVSSVFGVPLLIACSATTSEGTCVPSAIWLRFSAICTVLHLLMIAFDRYGLIVHPLRYPSYISYSRAMYALFVPYLTSLIVALTQLSWLNIGSIDVNEDADARTIEIEKRYFISCLVAFFLVPIVLMSYTYGHIFIISMRHNRAIHRQRGRPRLMRALGQCRGSLVLCAMLVVFIICWLPYFALGLQHHMGDELFPLPIWFEHLVVFLRFTPPLANPMLCTFFKQDFRQALRKLWMKRMTRYSRVGRCALRRKRKPRWRVVYSTGSEGSRVAFTMVNSADCTRRQDNSK